MYGPLETEATDKKNHKGHLIREKKNEKNRKKEK